MLAIVSSLVFLVAIAVALGVIASMISARRERIVGLLDGSMREVALPRAIRVKVPRRRRALHPELGRPAPAPRLAALRAAA